MNASTNVPNVRKECAIHSVCLLQEQSIELFESVVKHTPPNVLVCKDISPVYTRPLNQFGSQLSLSWLSVNVLNRFTSRLLNRFVNHVWEVV